MPTWQRDNMTAEESNSVKLPDITIDSKSKVGNHISDLCPKSSLQLKAINCFSHHHWKIYCFLVQEIINAFFKYSRNKNSINHCKKWSFPLSIFSVNVTKSAGNWRTFTEELLNRKPHFLCSECIFRFVYHQHLPRRLSIFHNSRLTILPIMFLWY